MEKAYLAFDLGAGSGRLMMGIEKDGKLELTELHRFTNPPTRMGERLYWDVPYQIREMKEGLKRRLKPEKRSSASVSIPGVLTMVILMRMALCWDCPIATVTAKTSGLWKTAPWILPICTKRPACSR